MSVPPRLLRYSEWREFFQTNNEILIRKAKLANMTPNKHYNTYKEGLELEVLREYCMEHGVVYDK